MRNWINILILVANSLLEFGTSAATNKNKKYVKFETNV